jgi:hypothetical protein
VDTFHRTLEFGGPWIAQSRDQRATPWRWPFVILLPLTLSGVPWELQPFSV